MQIEYKPSFDRAFKKLERGIQEKTYKTIDRILECLEKDRPFQAGLGLKNFGGNYWEIRIDIRNRIIFEIIGSHLVFWLVGNHNAIRRFIRRK